MAAVYPGPTAADDRYADPVDFNRDVRPIFANSCLQCHGPDENTRQAELRFDTAENVDDERHAYRIIDREHPDKSELLLRVASRDPDMQMPPPDSSFDRLSEQQIDTLRRWIEQGAPWAGHWAFIPPQRPKLPTVSNPTWPKNGIDHFILARLDREGLNPSRPPTRSL